jgi:hypothetical protein
MFVFWVDPENGQTIASPYSIGINNMSKEGRKEARGK